jgi:hypothetical protein
MISSRGMYMRNTADIILNMRYIRNADMNELGDMRGRCDIDAKG